MIKHGHQHGATPTPVTGAAAWFAGRIPDGWFAGPPVITADDDELLVVGPVNDVELAADATADDRATARAARVSRFREETRRSRMQIADEAAARYGRRVSWGVEVAGERTLFSTVAAPVMTRLRIDQRRVLDTLIEGGVARSRSEALAWCVRLVATHQDEWLAELRNALSAVEKVRAEGPGSA